MTTDQPAGHEVGYTWPGRHVECAVCRAACIPSYRVTEGRCGFVMPTHSVILEIGEGRVVCPGSEDSVDRPVQADLAVRIEEHVVSAMPPPHTRSDLTRGIHD